MSDGLDVVGGAGGLAASAARVADLASSYDDLSTRMRARARATLEAAAEPTLLATALASPGTFAEAEAALLAAAAGPDGAYGAALGWEADAVAVRAALAAQTATDHLAARAVTGTAYGLGAVLGPSLAGAALLAAPAVAALAGRLDGALVAHPALVAPGVLVAAGAADALAAPLLPAGLVALGEPGTGPAARRLAGAYGAEGPPVVERRRDLEPPGAVAPPRGVGDLVGGLRSTAGLAGTAPGSIAVDTLVGPDGSRRHVVHLPGTDDMATLPWTRDGDARDLGADLRLVGGQDTTYGAGVLDAMAAAGVRADEPVLLTGHSQGGMQALALAADPATPYDVRHVVLAGAPTEQAGPLPDDVEVLSLENRGDVVPMLDGAPARDAAHLTTVRFDSPPPPGTADGVVARHGLGHYVAAAAAVDAAEDPSLVDQRRRMTDLGFLDADVVERRVFTVARRP